MRGTTSWCRDAVMFVHSVGAFRASASAAATTTAAALTRKQISPPVLPAPFRSPHSVCRNAAATVEELWLCGFFAG